jgi:hypothetical protein
VSLCVFRAPLHLVHPKPEVTNGYIRPNGVSLQLGAEIRNKRQSNMINHVHDIECVQAAVQVVKKDCILVQTELNEVASQIAVLRQKHEKNISGLAEEKDEDIIIVVHRSSAKKNKLNIQQ